MCIAVEFTTSFIFSGTIMKPFILANLFVSCLCVANTSMADNLVDVYQQAQANDIQIQSARAQQKSKDYDVNIARGALLPQANVEFTHTYIDATSSNKSTDFKQDATLNALKVNASQALFDLQAWYQFQAARAVNDASNVELAFAEQQLILRVAESYFNTLKAKNRIDVVSSQKEAIENAYKQATSRYEAGIVSLTDVEQAKARLDLATANLVGQKISYAVKKEELEELTGTHYEHLDGLKADIPLSMPEPEDMTFWINQGLEHYPPLALAQASVDANRLQRNATRSAHLPKVKLFASYRDEENMPSNAFDKNITKTVGVQVSMPLLAGGSLYYQSKKAALTYANASFDVKKYRREIKRTVSSIYQQINANILMIKANKQSIVSSNSALNAVESGYNSGTRTILELLDAQGHLANAKKEYETARYDYVLNKLKLKLFAGQLNTNELNRVNELLEKS